MYIYMPLDPTPLLPHIRISLAAVADKITNPKMPLDDDEVKQRSAPAGAGRGHLSALVFLELGGLAPRLAVAVAIGDGHVAHYFESFQ